MGRTTRIQPRRASARLVRAALSAALLGPVVAAGIAVTSAAPAGASAPSLVAYVALETAGAVAEVNLASGAVVAEVTGISTPNSIAITPDGTTAYVTDIDGGTVTPIDLATMTAGTPISVGAGPTGIAITPDGSTAYVACQDAPDVTPIDLATNTAGTAIPMPANSLPETVVITPNGAKAFVGLYGSGDVVPIALPSKAVGSDIAVPGGSPDGLAITPNGATVYASTIGQGTVVPISVASGTVGTAITVGPLSAGTQSMAITPNGAVGLAPNFNEADVVPVALGTGTPGKAIDVGTYPESVAVTPNGSTAWVTRGFGSTGSLVPIDLATDKVGTPTAMAGGPAGIAIAEATLDATTTRLGTNHTSPSVGETVTLSATVATTSPGAPSPTGSVTFSDGGGRLCTAVVLPVSSPFTATCRVAFSSGGRRLVTATYTGSAADASSTSPGLAVTVRLLPTTTKLTDAPHPVRPGAPVTFTAKVTGSGPAPTGKVTFAIVGEGHHVVTCKGGDVVAVSHGAATCRVPAGLSATHAPYVVGAAYGGDDEHAASTATRLHVRV